jgi:hypothetical protein
MPGFNKPGMNQGNFQGNMWGGQSFKK